MNTPFKANALPVLIGSLPIEDHEQAADLVFSHTPEIPLWVQLPAYPEEGMIFQFMEGMPGLEIIVPGKDFHINTQKVSYSDETLKFFEDYLAVVEGIKNLDESRFALSPKLGRGFYVFLERLGAMSHQPLAVKGQITGPITLTASVKDQTGRAIYYDDQLRDAAVKMLAQKARWQVRQMSRFRCPVIMFLDEPALAGFGASEFIGLSFQDVQQCLEEVIAVIHAEGALAGVHICANSEWSLILKSSADILSFDAYSYFDRLLLYKQDLIRFLAQDRIIACGIIPTLKGEDIDRETTESLLAKYNERVDQISALGIDRNEFIGKSLITPSCGTGSLTLERALKVLSLTQSVSERIRKERC